MRLFDLPARGRSSPLSAGPAKGRTHTRTRAWIGMIALGALVVPGCDAAVEGPDDVRTATAITMASGDGQQGRVGSPLARQFVVRVSDARSEAVGDVEVTWKVTSGGGLLSLSRVDARPGSVLRTLTGDDGIEGVTAVLLTPTAPGTITVAATALGLQGSPVTFTARAIAPDWPPVPGSALIYERATSYHRSTLEFHGSLYERYVLYEDGTFGLQYDSGRFGFFEYPGTYSRVGTAFAFEFDGDSRWQATGTLSGDCLNVAYNLTMALSDFEDGEFCRPSDAP